MPDAARLNALLARVPHRDALLAACAELGVTAWIVGGTTRDLLLDRTPVDLDLATDAAEALARRLASTLHGHTVALDLAHDIWRVALPHHDYIDVCGFRDADIRGDLRGRDFTMNAIALSLTAPATLLDPLDGLRDLHAGLLRMAAPTAFRDDPLRILRAFRFQAELPLTIEPATWQALLTEIGQLPAMAPERLLFEWWKLCAGPYAPEVFARMAEAGVLAAIIPETAAMRGVTQNAYHHLDAWEHTLLATASLRDLLADPASFGELAEFFLPLCADAHRKARLVCIALLHDIGKPTTRSEKDGRVHFYQHEVAGAEIARDIALRLRMSQEDTRAVVTIIRHHLRPLHLLQASKTAPLSNKAMLRFFEDVGPYAPEVMALAIADKTAGRGPEADPDTPARMRAMYGAMLAFYRDSYLPSRQHPLLTGRDLMEALGLPAGEALGHWLREVQCQHALGVLTTREEAVRWVAAQQRKTR